MAHYRPLMILAICLILSVLLAPGAFATGSVSVSTIVSLVYEDVNLDGAYGLTASGVEASIPGVLLNLYVDNEPYSRLGPEDKLVQSLLSNREGYVVFRDLLPGAYLVNIEVPGEYIATNPTTQTVMVGGDAAGAVIEWLFGLTPRSRMPVRNFLPTVTPGPNGVASVGR
jgi:hypothetical protein